MKDDFFTYLVVFSIVFFLAAGAIFLWGVRTDLGLETAPLIQANGAITAAKPGSSMGRLIAGDLAKAVGGVGVVTFCLLLYFFPSINAQKRQHRELKSIFVLNLFLGGTDIGWIVALIWSYSSQVEPENKA